MLSYRPFVSPIEDGFKGGFRLVGSPGITGGAVQGSVLGILDHNAVLESLDDDIFNTYIAKYLDDMTLVESVPKDIDVEEDCTGNIPLHTISTCLRFNSKKLHPKAHAN